MRRKTPIKTPGHSLLAVALLLALVGCLVDGDLTGPKAVTPDRYLEAAKAVLDRYPDLLKMHGVVGTAIGLAADGRLGIKVLTEAAGITGLPTYLEGFPIDIEITGRLIALQQLDTTGAGTIDPKSRFARPVPIGVSTGNQGECSTGTIGCRVTDGTTVYALSNNHVLALENKAPLGSNVLQPYLTGCIFDPNNIIGTLANYEPIVFSTSDSNRIDAAIAVSSTAELGKATPSNGYGTPKSTTVSAFIGQQVQKYGQTTRLTHGTVTMIHATITVDYVLGAAQFVDQVIVQSPDPFNKSGDSGSLLVTDPDRNPVGLMFAGTSDGRLAVANPIDLVLSRFGVTIDGE